MSWIPDLAVIVIIALTVFLGYHRGFIQTVLQVAVWILAFVISLFICTPVAEMTFDVFMRESITESVSESLRGTDSSEERAEVLLEDVPTPLALLLKDNEGFHAVLEEYDAEKGDAADVVAESLVDQVVRPTAVGLLRFVVFLVLFVVLLIVLRIVKRMIKPVSKLPLIRKADGWLGGLLGAAKAVIYVFAFVSLLQMIAAFASEDFIFSQSVLDDTTIVKWVAEINPITKGI